MNKLEVFAKAFFDFLQRVVPGLIGAFAVGYKVASKQTSKALQVVRDLSLKLKYKENKDATDKHFEGKSDADIVADILDDVAEGGHIVSKTGGNQDSGGQQ